MGAWGASLYDDDNACDLRDTIALVCKVPVPGDRLLEILKGIEEDCDPAEDEGRLFWLVVADQFERRGIECREAAATARSIIESGADLASARENGADARFLKKRTAVLEELAKRLQSPRAFRPRVAPRNPPVLVLETGEVHAFRTMNGRAWNPYRSESEGPFTPDGWGAMVVLATGRAFDWLPWVALAGLTVSHERKATLEEALSARLIYNLQTEGAGRFVPKPSHARGLGLELLGRVPLDGRLVKPRLSKWGVDMAVAYDWTIAYGARGPLSHDSPKGCVLKTLVKNGG